MCVGILREAGAVPGFPADPLPRLACLPPESSQPESLTRAKVDPEVLTDPAVFFGTGGDGQIGSVNGSQVERFIPGNHLAPERVKMGVPKGAGANGESRSLEEGLPGSRQGEGLDPFELFAFGARVGAVVPPLEQDITFPFGVSRHDEAIIVEGEVTVFRFAHRLGGGHGHAIEPLPAIVCSFAGPEPDWITQVELVADPLAFSAVGEDRQVGTMSFRKCPGVLPGHGAVPEGVGAVVTPDCPWRQLIALAGMEGSLQAGEGVAEALKGNGGSGPGLGLGVPGCVLPVAVPIDGITALGKFTVPARVVGSWTHSFLHLPAEV